MINLDQFNDVMYFIRTTLTVDDLRLKVDKVREIKHHNRIIFRLFFFGFLTTLLSFFKSTFEFIRFENFYGSLAFGFIERIAIFYSGTVSICGSMFFNSILQSVPVEFKILGQSMEQNLNRLEKEIIDDNQLDDIIGKLKSHIRHHQSLLE